MSSRILKENWADKAYAKLTKSTAKEKIEDDKHSNGSKSGRGFNSHRSNKRGLNSKQVR